jgi:hypothetical protein
VLLFSIFFLTSYLHLFFRNIILSPLKQQWILSQTNELSMLQTFNQHHTHEVKMNKEINIHAVTGLAIATAIFRLNFVFETTINEFIEHDCWDEVAELAFEYIKWVGIDTKEIEIDKYVIAQSFWGLDGDELDDALSECQEEEEDFSY